MFQHSQITKPTTKTIKKFFKVRQIKDGVCLSVPYPDYPIDPRIKARSVTPINRAQNGMLTPVNTANFVQPSFEDMQRIVNEVEKIDDAASREAAYNKFMDQFNQPTETPTETKTAE